MLVKNPTKYCNEYSKFYNVVLDKGSFSYESSIRMSYYQRLYYELEYTRKVNGIAFFFTLTYCDAKVPKFLNRNVHSYKDVRLLVNGSISKVLLRNYGARLRYFCACETGEGGDEQHHSRGLGNNPHYHFIFFVQPCHDKSNKPIYDGYTRISVPEFTFLLREFWLGKGEGYYNYKNANYGVVKEGKFGAEIKSPEAFGYVIKYVIKDVYSEKTDSYVFQHYYNKCLESSFTWFYLYQYYLYQKQYKSWYNKSSLFTEFGLHDYWFQRKFHITSLPFDKWLDEVANDYIKGNVCKFKDWFEHSFCESYAKYKLREFNNSYGPKVRLSNGLGEYGLNFIKDVTFNPQIVLNYGNQLVSQYPSLYYIRKLYYYVVKCPYTGNPLYRLNELGVNLRESQLLKKLQTFRNTLNESLSYVLENSIKVPTKFDIYKYRCYLDALLVNKEIKPVLEFFSDSFLKSFFLRNDFDYILKAYTIYTNVYQYRSFNRRFSMIALTSELDMNDVLADYHYFLVNMPSLLDYDSCGVYSLVTRCPEIISFKSYYVFAPYLEYFDFLDSLINVVSEYRSIAKKALFAQHAEHNKRINAMQVNFSEL